MKKLWLIVLIASGVVVAAQTVSYYNSQLLSKPSAAADRAFLGITNGGVGPPGPAGPPGIQGIQGIQGTAGVNGTNGSGTNGTNGINGTNGTGGGSGILGVTTCITNGLVGWWKFNENTGTTAADSSGNGLTATNYAGVIWSTGIIGSGVQLSGASQFFRPTNITTSFRNSFTLNCWVYPTTNIATSLMYAVATERTAGNYWAVLGCYNYRFSCSLYDGSSNPTIYSPVNYPTNTWSFLSLVRDNNGNSRNLYLYVNGVLSATVADTTVSQSHSNFVIGGQITSAGRFWVGRIDEVSAFSRALSPGEISWIYNYGMGCQ